jgi:long-chain acyl-CoA synthetase
MISNANLHAMAFSYFVDVDEVRTADATLYAAPMSHGAGIYNFMHVMRGARHVVPESSGFEPDEVLALARSLRDVSMFAAPTMVRRLVDRAKKEGSNGDGIRTIVYGGGPMYVADIEEAVTVMGPRFVQIYGQGESPMTITALSRAGADRVHPRWRGRLGSVGVAQSCMEVRIAMKTDIPCLGEAGEILVRSAGHARLWRNPEATTKQSATAGWTGDVGSMDVDGFLTLKTDRRMLSSQAAPTSIHARWRSAPSASGGFGLGCWTAERRWGGVVAFVVESPTSARYFRP